MWWGDVKTLNIWKEEKVEEIDDGLNIDIKELDLSARSFNRLRRNDCYTIRDVLDLMETKGLKRISGLGENSIKEIELKMEPYINK